MKTIFAAYCESDMVEGKGPKTIDLESLSEMKCLEKEKLKNKALAKLTDAEKKALGLSDKPATR